MKAGSIVAASISCAALLLLLTKAQGAHGGGAMPGLSSRGLVLTQQARQPLPKTEVAAFAAGCFWGVEQEFRKTPGVVATAVGFEGGHTVNPSYEDVCTHTTGHAETTMVEYDPSEISYDQLLDVFWHLHDPTTKDRQGPDFGDQYRSAIFYFTPEQRKAALASRDKLQASGELDAPIVTEIVPQTPFYKAEEYHQQYVEKGGIAFCHVRRNKK
jgi:peptide-methionine (S)-S-oxide reductase